MVAGRKICLIFPSPFVAELWSENAKQVFDVLMSKNQSALVFVVSGKYHYTPEKWGRRARWDIVDICRRYFMNYFEGSKLVRQWTHLILLVIQIRSETGRQGEIFTPITFQSTIINCFFVVELENCLSEGIQLSFLSFSPASMWKHQEFTEKGKARVQRGWNVLVCKINCFSWGFFTDFLTLISSLETVECWRKT